MRKAGLSFVCGIAILSLTLPSFADKFKADTTLKEVQSAGLKAKDMKHQVYDLSFEAQGKSYTCRTDSGKSMDATEFIVGTSIRLELDGNKAKLKTPQNKKIECEIVRAEVLPAAR